MEAPLFRRLHPGSAYHLAHAIPVSTAVSGLRTARAVLHPGYARIAVLNVRAEYRDGVYAARWPMAASSRLAMEAKPIRKMPPCAMIIFKLHLAWNSWK